MFPDLWRPNKYHFVSFLYVVPLYVWQAQTAHLVGENVAERSRHDYPGRVFIPVPKTELFLPILFNLATFSDDPAPFILILERVVLGYLYSITFGNKQCFDIANIGGINLIFHD